MAYLTVFERAGRTESHPSVANRFGATSMSSLEPEVVQVLYIVASKITER